MAAMEPRMIHDIAALLFPEGNGEGELADLVEHTTVILEFTLAEVTTAYRRFRIRGKAPVPNGIPSHVCARSETGQADRRVQSLPEGRYRSRPMEADGSSARTDR